MSERNPISIDAGKKIAKSKKTSSRSSAAKRDKTPAPAKRAGGRRSTATNSAGKAKASGKAKSSTRKAANKASVEPKNSAPSAPVAPRLPENRHPGLHDRSYAAHLDGGPREPHTKPAGDLRFLAPFPTGRKQP